MPDADRPPLCGEPDYERCPQCQASRHEPHRDPCRERPEPTRSLPADPAPSEAWTGACSCGFTTGDRAALADHLTHRLACHAPDRAPRDEPYEEADRCGCTIRWNDLPNGHRVGVTVVQCAGHYDPGFEPDDIVESADE